MAPTALERAYRYLNRRERTVAEVRAHLCAHDASEQEVDAVVSELREHGFLDDARYACLFAQDRRKLDGWGEERIRRALAERGIERELIDAAIASSGDRGDELVRALDLLRHRFAQPPRERRERDRALGVLLRKGYDSELALDAVASFARDG